MTFGKVIRAHGGGAATVETEDQAHVSEAALGHASFDALERAYRRGDALEKRRALMSDWAAYLDTGK